MTSEYQVYVMGGVDFWPILVDGTYRFGEADPAFFTAHTLFGAAEKAVEFCELQGNPIPSEGMIAVRNTHGGMAIFDFKKQLKVKRAELVRA